MKNTICSVSLDGSGTMEVLVEGAVYLGDGQDSNGQSSEQLGKIVCWKIGDEKLPSYYMEFIISNK